MHTTLRRDAQHTAVARCKRNAPVRGVQRAVGTLDEPVREARKPGQHVRPLTRPAIEPDEVGGVGRPRMVQGEDLDAIEIVAMPCQTDERVAGFERQRIARKMLVEYRQLGRAAVLAERADEELLARWVITMGLCSRLSIDMS